jgi:hypothetical protein
MKLLAGNLTTIDHVENKRKQKIKTIENAFNVGLYKNISNVMGNFFIWLLPISVNHNSLDGYLHDINKEYLNRNTN